MSEKNNSLDFIYYGLKLVLSLITFFLYNVNKQSICLVSSGTVLLVTSIICVCVCECLHKHKHKHMQMLINIIFSIPVH